MEKEKAGEEKGHIIILYWGNLSGRGKRGIVAKGRERRCRREVEIDEKTLTQIAGTTDGNYFRATSNSKLKEVYEEIDKLEKTKLNVKEYSKRQEEYRWFALAAFLCILLEVLLRNSILKKIP